MGMDTSMHLGIGPSPLWQAVRQTGCIRVSFSYTRFDQRQLAKELRKEENSAGLD